MKGDERQRCAQGDFSTRFRRKHHIGYLDGDLWIGACCHDCALCTNSDRLATGCGGSARVRAIALFAAIVSVQTSPSKSPMWCFRLNRVEKSPWPHFCRSSPFTGLYLRDREPYRLQSTTARCVFVRTIRPMHLNGSIRHEALEAAGATPFRLFSMY